MTLLTQVSDEYNYAIYFSTHSIELIRGIKPENIFYIERHSDNSLEVLNPCYPAYATKFLYDHSGYDRIILVEDDLAKEIIRRILKKESMMNNKLVHVLPCGGWNNVLDLADDVIRNNLLGKRASICIILDGDIKDQADKYRKKIHNSIPTNYLPIKSLEKYLRSKLVLSVDHKLYRHLTDYIFQQKSLAEIIDEYKRISRYDWEKDSNGKTFYSLLNDELQKRNKDRAELIETIVDFPVTIQIKLDQSFRLNLFLSYLQRIAFLGELLGQRSRHESLRRPLIEPVRRHIVLNTFGSLESRDFRTRKNPSINRFSLAVSSLPHIPY